MRNTEKVRRSAAPNLLVQFPLAELTLQVTVDSSKSRRSILARADGRFQQKPTVDPSKSRRLIPTVPSCWSLFKVRVSVFRSINLPFFFSSLYNHLCNSTLRTNFFFCKGANEKVATQQCSAITKTMAHKHDEPTLMTRYTKKKKWDCS
jgi:hypothetical protein